MLISRLRDSQAQIIRCCVFRSARCSAPVDTGFGSRVLRHHDLALERLGAVAAVRCVPGHALPGWLTGSGVMAPALRASASPCGRPGAAAIRPGRPVAAIFGSGTVITEIREIAAAEPTTALGIGRPRGAGAGRKPGEFPRPRQALARCNDESWHRPAGLLGDWQRG